MKQLIIVAAVLLLASCGSFEKKEDKTATNSDSTGNIYPLSINSKGDTIKNAPPQPSINKNAVFEVKPFDNSKNVAGNNFTGFGYDIYIDGKLTIRQPNKPAVAGNAGFKSEEEAKKVGEFMANKIRNNIMPPTVDLKELASMGVDTTYKK